jgi:hypothetical protein
MRPRGKPDNAQNQRSEYGNIYPAKARPIAANIAKLPDLLRKPSDVGECDDAAYAAVTIAASLPLMVKSVDSSDSKEYRRRSSAE